MATKRFNRGVALVGAGMSNFGAFPGKTTRDLFVEAFKDMHTSVDKGFDPKDIDECYFGNYSSSQFEGQGFTAPFIANAVGMNPKPAIRTENACASGGSAIRLGWMAIASGIADMVLVGGYEKETVSRPRRSPKSWPPLATTCTRTWRASPFPACMPLWRPPTCTATVLPVRP